MNGKLIVIEGVDGSGKATQSSLLYERIKNAGFETTKVDFPRYDNPSSSLVRMYLNGDFGNEAKEISPYIASTFYAGDRYASFKMYYEGFMNNGGVVIADRYTTANMIHQAGKIHDKNERENFLKWLWDYEFGLYKLPIPDLVFFLDVPVEFNEKLMSNRENKDGVRQTKDIHERDKKHLLDSYNNAIELVDRYSWTRINCIKGGKLRTIEDINNEIFDITLNKIE